MRHRDRAAQAVGATSISAVRTRAPTSPPLWTEIRVRRLRGGHTSAFGAEGRAARVLAADDGQLSPTGGHRGLLLFRPPQRHN
jgi:hypothetical protein